MKLVSLAETILKWMVKRYKVTDHAVFDFSTIKNEFYNYSDEDLCTAIYLLEHDGFVSVLPGDNIPYITTLLLDGIRNCEENTFLSKGYSLIKEIKSFLS